ncbi:MAG: hypothetical protein HY482_00400 [Candidatus Wildermuthbacteria bacterium]|nr:hypothetical protein [Candidatus Wildermuthbacteria bacterium]
MRMRTFEDLPEWAAYWAADYAARGVLKLFQDRSFRLSLSPPSHKDGRDELAARKAFRADGFGDRRHIVAGLTSGPYAALKAARAALDAANAVAAADRTRIYSWYEGGDRVLNIGPQETLLRRIQEGVVYDDLLVGAGN